jgi:hypothetical protein
MRGDRGVIPQETLALRLAGLFGVTGREIRVAVTVRASLRTAPGVFG